MAADNEATKNCDAAGDNFVDAAEVIRRLDNLWSESSAVVAGPFTSSVGTTVGRYVLERIIGRGAFGVVYKARDPDLNRSVAIKIPRPDVLLDSDRLARFEREVQACARLDHPGIVPLYEADLSRAVPYMASAYCPGPNLQQWMDDSPMPCDVEAAVSFIEKVARAVHYAHENGVVHRDLKPGNILLVPIESESAALTTLNDFQPRLTDFGLAQMTHGLHESQSSLIIGTPLYMSPEQAESRSDDVGPRSDIFGLGAILYHLLTGVAPFAARNYAAVLLRLREETPVAVSQLRPDVSSDLETVCMKCLQRSSTDRYRSAEELADDLQRCLRRQPIHGRRMSLLQRLHRWTQQSARVYEATLLIIVLAIIRLIFGPGGLLMVMMSPDVTITNAECIEAFLAHLFLTAPVDCWMIWAARRNLSQRSSQKSYWLAAGISATLCLITLFTAIGIIPAMQWYQRSVGARVLTFSFISLTYFVQTLAWATADWRRIDHSPAPNLRRHLKLLLITLPLFLVLTVPAFRYLSHQAEPTMLAGPADSIQLDGIDDFVAVENIGFESQAPLTMEAWIRPNKSHRGTIICHGPISLTVIAAGTGNRFRAQISASADQVYMLDAKEIFGLNRWTHVAMTYDGSEIHMYVNGRLQQWDTSMYDGLTNQTVSDQTFPSPFSLTDLWQGSRLLVGNLQQSDGGSNFQFSGRIGEVRLNRSVYYQDEFAPEHTLSPGPDTAMLLHLQDGTETLPDATGRHGARVKR